MKQNQILADLKHITIIQKYYLHPDQIIKDFLNYFYKRSCHDSDTRGSLGSIIKSEMMLINLYPAGTESDQTLPSVQSQASLHISQQYRAWLDCTYVQLFRFLQHIKGLNRKSSGKTNVAGPGVQKESSLIGERTFKSPVLDLYLAYHCITSYVCNQIPLPDKSDINKNK